MHLNLILVIHVRERTTLTSQISNRTINQINRISSTPNQQTVNRKPKYQTSFHQRIIQRFIATQNFRQASIGGTLRKFLHTRQVTINRNINLTPLPLHNIYTRNNFRINSTNIPHNLSRINTKLLTRNITIIPPR